MSLGQQAFELVVLRFELTKPLGICSLHATVLSPPLVERGVAEAALPAQLLDRHAHLGLLEEPNDLLLGESALPHVHHSPG